MFVKKRIFVILGLVFILCSVFTSVAFAEDKVLTIRTIDSVVQQGRILIPAADLAKKIGASYEWDQTQQQIKITSGRYIVLMKIASNNADVIYYTASPNLAKQTISLDIGPQLNNGAIIIPLRVVAENLGGKVSWDAKSKTATITFNDRFGSVAETANSYLSSKPNIEISAKELYNNVVLKNDPSFTIVSLRKPEDYAKGHIKGATLIFRKDFGKIESLVKLNKNNTIVPYCYTGTGASYVSAWLNLMGYKARTLHMGLLSWTSNKDVLATPAYPKSMNYPVEIASVINTEKYPLPLLTSTESDQEKIIEELGRKYFATTDLLSISNVDLYNKFVVNGDNSYFVVDVRTSEQYKNGHIKNAVNIPFNELAKIENLQRIPADKIIILVSDDGMDAGQGSMVLNLLGYDARILLFGMMGWNGQPSFDGVAEFPWEGTVK